MKNFKSTFSPFESCDLKPFNEMELAMVMGGGGDDQVLNFPGEDYDSDGDDDEFGS